MAEFHNFSHFSSLSALGIFQLPLLTAETPCDSLRHHVVFCEFILSMPLFKDQSIAVVEVLFQ